jgi:hypothetical protein
MLGAGSSCKILLLDIYNQLRKMPHQTTDGILQAAKDGKQHVGRAVQVGKCRKFVILELLSGIRKMIMFG